MRLDVEVTLKLANGFGFEVVNDFIKRLEREHWRSLMGRPCWPDEIRSLDLTPSPTEER